MRFLIAPSHNGANRQMRRAAERAAHASILNASNSPVPETADDPACLNTTGSLLPIILFGATVIFLACNINVWGIPLVLVSILIATYTFGTVTNWYLFGAEDQNKYLITILSSEEPRSLTSGREFVRDALIDSTAGLLGRFLNVLLLLVFLYVILGALFGRCAGGQALIKLAFSMTRNLRGGPAHAAVVSFAMFGTITGGPVVNVLSTGVLTVPMMVKRGFSKVSSALAGFDRKALSAIEVVVRLALAVLILFRPFEVYGPALASAAVLMAFHVIRGRETLRV